MILRRIENIFKLDSRLRFDYFIRKVVDFEVVWGLYGTGWAASIVNGEEVIPFWPEEEFARICADGEWKGFSAKAILLDNFLLKWLPGMKRDGRRSAVFPNVDGKAVVVDVDELYDLIVCEKKQYE